LNKRNEGVSWNASQFANVSDQWCVSIQAAPRHIEQDVQARRANGQQDAIILSQFVLFASAYCSPVRSAMLANAMLANSLGEFANTLLLESVGEFAFVLLTK
jgi:hypothetical protein